MSSTNPFVVLNSLMVPFAQEAATIDASSFAKITDWTRGRSKVTHSTLSLKEDFDFLDLVLSSVGVAGIFQTLVLPSLPQVATSCLWLIRLLK